MATMSKRPPPMDSETPEAKRLRSADGEEAEAERKRAETRARMEAIKAKLAAKKATTPAVVPDPTSASTSAPPPPSASTPVPPPAPEDDLESKKAKAQRQIEEIKAKLAAKNRGAPAAAAPSPSVKQQTELERRTAEVNRRLDKQQRLGLAPRRTEESNTARGGLAVGLHPSLLGDVAPKPKTAPKPRPDKAAANPYLSIPDSDPEPQNHDPSLTTKKPGERKSRQLVFNQKGKFEAQARALRDQARLEQMKLRIAEEARKHAIEVELDKAFLVPLPPETEWWDEGLISPSGDYKITTPDSIITALVQHPVILQPPQEKFTPGLKPLPLTTKEQKKLRRQRRTADMKEEQAKIRLGLVEPPPPKAKKSNMMRIYGDLAIQDPTAVQTLVNAQIAQRAEQHKAANAERQLSPSARAAKLQSQQAADEAKGVFVAVFAIKSLCSGKHRYLVDINAKQNALTGIVILNPEMNLVLVEGGAHSIKKYKKLLLSRVRWEENVLPLNATGGSTTFVAHAEEEGTAKWISPVDDEGKMKDLSGNVCRLIWEGSVATRGFKRWGSKICETDGEARDALRRNKMENMWTLARSRALEEEEEEGV
ncbi:PRP3-domain-containing protein [Piedraia hortae CBS 480.64]|uniref:PRP3-domain-containing protein n=1 Tax=Piedraia hortae CBS 480.64 TaxID=1314780 RepID=A0A6A7BW13_9PEZI|nr:PRP3-domain-containing protein [Piedraia hortae CBS 480.64]